MKVFFIGAASLDSMMGDTMESHILTAFDSMGITTAYFSFLSGGLGRRLNRLLERAMTDLHWIKITPAEHSLLKAIRAFEPDMLLVLLGNYTSPSTIAKIRRLTTSPIVCWCQDHMGTMGRQYIIGAKYDYIFSKDQFMVDQFRKFTRLPQVHYLAEACNPRIHNTVTPTIDDMHRYGCEVTTAASLYYFRSEILESISDFDLRIWGPIPRYYEGPMRTHAKGVSVHTRNKAACFNSAKIVINTLYPLEIGGLNARAFEVAGCGGFQLISHTDAISRHFEVGKEIETFRNLDELREKVLYYLNNEIARTSIAKAGQLRAHSEHTYEHRLKEMLDVVGIH